MCSWHFNIWQKYHYLLGAVNFTVSEFLAGIVDINAVVRQYCRNTETKDQARLYQFMRDLIACRDWYDRDSGCILSRDELCDIVNFLAANWCMFAFIACFLYFWLSCVFFHYSVLRVRFYNKIIIIILLIYVTIRSAHPPQYCHIAAWRPCHAEAWADTEQTVLFNVIIPARRVA